MHVHDLEITLRMFSKLTKNSKRFCVVKQSPLFYIVDSEEIFFLFFMKIQATKTRTWRLATWKIYQVSTNGIDKRKKIFIDKPYDMKWLIKKKHQIFQERNTNNYLSSQRLWKTTMFLIRNTTWIVTFHRYTFPHS